MRGSTYHARQRFTQIDAEKEEKMIISTMGKTCSTAVAGGLSRIEEEIEPAVNYDDVIGTKTRLEG